MVSGSKSMQFQSGVGAFGRLLLCSVLLSTVAASIAALPAIATTREETPFQPRHDLWLPEWMLRAPEGPGPMSRTMMTRLLRHATFLNDGVPKDYEGQKSTVAPGPDAIADGRQLYRDRCSSCHGSNGMGDGDVGRALSPSPAVLAYMITRPISVDPYLLWSISDGGKQFESDMPSFKDKLTREEIWKIIAYMRAGFPDGEGKPLQP